MEKNCSQPTKCIFGTAGTVNRRRENGQVQQHGRCDGGGIPKVQERPLENPVNPIKPSVKKDPLYDSAAEVKGEVKEVMLCWQNFC